MSEEVISNASPLICLAKANLLHLIPSLFKEISIPGAVEKEILAGPPDDPLRKSYRSLGWLKTVELRTKPSPLLTGDLGPGETEVLELARIKKAAVLLDDYVARQCAKHIGLKVYGTLGIVLLAYKRGILENVEDAFEKIKKAGLWFSEDLAQALLKDIGQR